MKKFLVALLTVLMVICCAFAIACGKQTGLEYKLINGDTEYEVVGIGTCTDMDIVIPNIYENKPVTSIGDYAFSGCSSLTSIEIPNSVTNIGYSAFFFCESLTSIEIPNSVTSISDSAFYKCSSLASIVIPNSVTSIGAFAFTTCGSTTIYCEAESEPSGWDSLWNYSNCPVVWGYDGN